jgi:hypothetical protein
LTLLPSDGVGASVGQGSTTAGSPADGVQFTVVLPWSDGGTIDAAYTCAGDDISPQVSWYGAPTTAVEMALVVTDTDANDFVHWIIAGLDPKNPSIPAGTPPENAVQGQNGFSTAAAPSVGWKGPCAPAGTTHHYLFTLYALGQQIELPSGSSAADLLAFIQGAEISATTVTGTSSTP